MKFRSTWIVLLLALALGAYVYLHEVRGGRSREKARADAERLLGITAADVTAVRIEHTGTTYDLQKRGTGWFLLRPLPAPCDPRTIQAYLDTLAAARREDEVGRGDLVQYGLDAPSATVEIDTPGGTRRLRFGRINPLQTLVYALVDDSKEVVLTTSALLTQSLNNALGWRDKRMVTADPDAVVRMTMRTRSDGTRSIRRDPPFGWRVEGNVPWRVDPVRARTLFLGLARLEAQGVAAENKVAAAQYGVDSRRVGAVLEADGGAVVGDVVFGFGSGKDAYFSIVPDKPEVFQVDARLVDTMIEVVRDPLDRKALPPFFPERIDRIRVEAPDDVFELRRRSAVDWKVVASQRADSTYAIATGAVDAMLGELATLEVAAFPDRQPPPTTYDPPTIRVLLFEGAQAVSGLEVGKRDPQGMNTVARGPGEPAVFLISPAALLSLPFDLERLKAAEEPAPEGGDRG